jgi:hypothetical protein
MFLVTEDWYFVSHRFELAIAAREYGSLAARIVGTRSVVNALGGLGYVFSSTGLRAKMLRWIIMPALRFALGGKNARLIVQNGDDWDRIVTDGLASAGSISLIRGAGVDPNAYRQVMVASEMPLVILRLLWEKGVGEFVEAARLLREQGIKARFALVGKLASPASVSQSDIDAWVGEGVVEYWGWQDDMPGIFSQAQIVCLPTYYGEGLPKSLLEAAASGCAIVTTDIPSCREIVRHGVTGWLVPTRDVRALANALQQAIEQPDMRERYGASARASIATDFSMNRIACETIAVYDRLMAHHE